MVPKQWMLLMCYYVGSIVGVDVGSSVGADVGCAVGDEVGEGVGKSRGSIVGDSTGAGVGDETGRGVIVLDEIEIPALAGTVASCKEVTLMLMVARIPLILILSRYAPFSVNLESKFVET
jgi:hypothetical protein